MTGQGGAGTGGVTLGGSLQSAEEGPARRSCQPRIRPSRCASRSPNARTSRTIQRGSGEHHRGCHPIGPIVHAALLPSWMVSIASVIQGRLPLTACQPFGISNQDHPTLHHAVRRQHRGGSCRGSGRAESWVPAVPAGRQDGGDPSNRGRAVTRRQRGMPLDFRTGTARHQEWNGVAESGRHNARRLHAKVRTHRVDAGNRSDRPRRCRRAGAQSSTTNPYRATFGWEQLPEGRVMGTVSGVFPDPDGRHLWILDRCGANQCAGTDLDPIMKFDLEGNLVDSFGAGLFAFPHGFFLDHEGFLWVTEGGIARRRPGDAGREHGHRPPGAEAEPAGRGGDAARRGGGLG